MPTVDLTQDLIREYEHLFALATVRAVWLAYLHPDRVQSGTTGRFVFAPDS